MPDNSHISVSPHATVFAGKDATLLFANTAVATGLSFYAKTGKMLFHGSTITHLRRRATQITGKAYGRGRPEAQRAADDVRRWCAEMKAALPVTHE
jgi:hypothetical protein